MPTREELSKLTKIPPSRTSRIEFSGRAEEARSLIILPGADSVPEKFTESKSKEAPPDAFESIKPPNQEISTSSDSISSTAIPKKHQSLENHPLRASSSPTLGDPQRDTLRERLRRPDELPAPRAPSQQKTTSPLVLENLRSVPPGLVGNLQLGILNQTTRTDEIAKNALRKTTNRKPEASTPKDITSENLQGGYVPPLPGNTGSNLELLSDPRGVDFRPYLTRILIIVRRNWHAVIPESARLGINRGNVSLQFSISRDGTVPKLVIFHSSGVPELDRAAVASISASNPFPPLPDEFTGQVVRLQFKFSYNMK
tara:strand:+ start:5241 stop:6179 length:939 start_codon:yes stop_codon:yes gene_type:complete